MRDSNPIETARWLNQNGLVPRNPNAEDLDYRCYNCWGFTAYMLDWEEILYWLGGNEMENYLEDYSEPLDKPEPGAIAVFRTEWGELTHTALVVKVPQGRLTPLLVQKPGELRLEVRSVADTYREHSVYHRVSEYRRPINRDES